MRWVRRGAGTAIVPLPSDAKSAEPSTSPRRESQRTKEAKSQRRRRNLRQLASQYRLGCSAVFRRCAPVALPAAPRDGAV